MHNPNGTTKFYLRRPIYGTKNQGSQFLPPTHRAGQHCSKARAYPRCITRATSLVEGTVDQAVKEVRDQVIEFCRAGRAVKVDGLGTFTPTIDLDGYFAISFRADTALNAGINMAGVFSGKIINREHIGKTSDELITKWNEEHAEDPVTVTD